MFKFLRLPVVSYALPALIAIGLVRHEHRPSRNPVAVLARRLARRRALLLLEKIQPSSGGYLEATPLTSFVVMSLIGAGLDDHPVVTRGIEFLVRSARPDGSWPIDTNLATWVTTLSVMPWRSTPISRKSSPSPSAKKSATGSSTSSTRASTPTPSPTPAAGPGPTSPAASPTPTTRRGHCWR